MAVLTCAEMVAQCLGGQESGWRHFISGYLPFSAALLERHSPRLGDRREALLREVLLRSRDSDAAFFRDYHGHSEREFLLHLREQVLHVLEEAEPAAPAPEIPLDWDAFDKALQGFTALERQVVWMLVLCPAAQDAEVVLRMDAQTAKDTLAKAQERLRTSLDRWSASMLQENRHVLAESARMRQTKDCGDPRLFLRTLDGQITWRDRMDLEHHVASCGYCVDLLCRFREVVYVARKAPPLTEAETEACLKAIGLSALRPPRWKRLLGVA